jgi:hypothetical protein
VNEPSPLPPSQEQGLALLDRLRSGSRTASSDLGAAYLDWLATHVRRHNPAADEHACQTAAEDAVLSLIRHPDADKPDRLSLDRFLVMAAQPDLKNLLAAERRHHLRFRAGDDAPYLRVVALSDNLAELTADEFADPRWWRSSVKRCERPSPPPPRPCRRAYRMVFRQKRHRFTLMRVRERRTAVYAQMLGIGHLPQGDQRLRVKKVKDKLNARVKRAGGKL